MIPVANPIAQPADFDDECRKPGLSLLWRTRRPKRFPGHWQKFQPDLADGFQNRCGWWAMQIEDGAVDHFLSKKKHPRLAYTWSNYRYIAATVNSSKGNLDERVLDPFEVQTGWFEILLPSMHLVRTAAVPVPLQAKADFTIKRLWLIKGIKVRRNRLRWYEGYKRGRITLAGLREYAPLVADAVEKWEATGVPLP